MQVNIEKITIFNFNLRVSEVVDNGTNGFYISAILNSKFAAI